MSKKLILFLMLALFGSTSFYRANAQTTIGFETGDFSEYAFVNEGTYPWVVTSNDANTGTYCMMSSNGGNASTSSVIEATVDFLQDGSVSFAALCMGEGTSTIWDKCEFYIDNQMQFQYGANQPGWNDYSYDVTAGTHTFKWSYSKDSSVNPTGDYFMVDDIVFMGTAGGGAGGYGGLVNIDTIPNTNIPEFQAWVMGDPNVEMTTLELLYPADGEMNVANPVFLQWTTDPNAAEYKIEFGSTYPPTVLIDWTAIDETYPASPSFLDVTELVQPNSHYFWRISIRNNVSELTSDLYGFTKMLEVPGALTASAEQIYEGESVTISWTGPGSGGAPTPPGPGPTPPTGNELTVYDGTATNNRVPMYVFYFDDFARSQYIIPAADLAGINGRFINALKYYTTNSNVPYTTVSTVEFYITEVDYTTITEYVNVSDAQVVYTGTVDFTADQEATITFDTPYEYRGGNLLIGCDNLTDAGYKNIYFYGETVAGASISGSNGSSSAAAPATAQNFIPKTTLIFDGAKGDRSVRGYNIYVDGAQHNTEPVTNTYYVLEDLRYDVEEGHSIYVTAIHDEGESLPSNEVVVYVSGYGAIDGTVTELSSGEPMSGVEIKFKGTDEFGNNVQYTTTTNADGAFSFENVKAGEYTFGRAKLNGYEPNFIDAPLTIVEGNTESVRFTLHIVYTPVTQVFAYEMDATTTKIQWSFNGFNPYVPPTPGGGGGSGPNPPTGGWTVDFESGIPSGWATIDADGDGYNWSLGSDLMGTGYGHNGSNDLILSQSYDNNYGALTPDNYLVTPQVTPSAGSTFSFWACAQDNAWAGEHFGVAVSTNSQTSASDFTMLQEWTMTAKASSVMAPGRDGQTRAQGTWYNYSVDLSAYAGQNIYIAIRHFNSTDWFYLDVDDVTFTASKNRDDVTYDFESGLMGWTTIDADGDGYNWMLASEVMGSGYGHNGSSDLVLSQSYNNNVGALTPDNYLVSPAKAEYGQISFWACAQDNAWAAEHFGVAVSTSSTPSADNFTMVQEWTMTAKSSGSGIMAPGRDGQTRAQGNWYEYGVDLSAYAGQEIWVAIRHFNSTDYFYLDVDDITLSSDGSTPGQDPPTPPTPGGGSYDNLTFSVYKRIVAAEGLPNGDTTLIAEGMTDTIMADFNWLYDGPGLYQYGVQAVYPTSRNRSNRESVVIDFETGDFSQFDFVNNSPQPWTVVSGGHNNSYSMKSGNAGVASSTSAIEATYDFPTEGTISFAALCMGEGTSTIWDKCEFYIDGQMQFQYGANQSGWHDYSYSVSEGEHTFKWSYTKDGSVNPTGDYFMVDDIVFTFEDLVSHDDPNTEIIWSNYLYKDMETSLTLTAHAEAGSINGAVVTFTNLNENLVYTTELDETGVVEYEEFRKGEYTLTVELYGYNTYEETISVWNTTNLDVTLTENFLPVDELIVSGTGFARWTNMIPADVAMRYHVTLEGALQGLTTDNFMQLDVTNLVEGETYTAAVAVVYSTGMSEFVETEFVYTGCVSATQVEDLQGVANCMDIMLSWNGGTPVPPTPPTPPTPGGGWTVDFESGIPSGWATIDADGDGFNWMLASEGMGTGYGHNGSSDMVLSQSYNNNYGALTPDNYIVTPQVTPTAGSTFSFWACAQDNAWAGEHFGVAISTGSQTNANDFTTVQEWTMTAKASGVMAPGRDGQTRAQGNWYEYSVDLSSYAGQNIYVAIRHFNCTDWFYLDVDDVTFTADEKSGNTFEAAGKAQITSYAVPTDDGNWYYYDNGTNYDAIGLTSGGSFWWGIMFPAGSYEGNKLSKISYYDSTPSTGQVLIYQGGTSQPGTLLYTQAYSTSGTDNVVEINMDEPVTVNNAENLWVIMHNLSGQYVASYDGGVGQTNGSWLSTDNSTWYSSLSSATGGSYDGNWNIRAYIETGSGGTSTTTIQANKFNIFMDGEFIAATGDNAFTYTVEDFEEHTFEVYYVDEDYNFSCPATIAMTAGAIEGVTNLDFTMVDPYVTLTWNGTAETYVIWRGLVDMSTGNVNLDVVGETTSMTYTDELPQEAGYVLYLVQSVVGECETDLQEEINNGSYVLINYDDVNESEIVNAIYPNPTNGELHINATAMTHISVFNAMGQMVYDADVNCDETILNMGQYNAGIYMVNIVTKNGSSMQRIIVTK